MNNLQLVLNSLGAEHIFVLFTTLYINFRTDANKLYLWLLFWKCVKRWKKNIWPFRWTSCDLILPTMVIPSDHQAVSSGSRCSEFFLKTSQSLHVTTLKNRWLTARLTILEKNWFMGTNPFLDENYSCKSLRNYQSHPKPSPPDKSPQHDSKGAETLPRDNHCVQNPPSGQNKEFKGPTPGT